MILTLLTKRFSLAYSAYYLILALLALRKTGTILKKYCAQPIADVMQKFGIDFKIEVSFLFCKHLIFLFFSASSFLIYITPGLQLNNKCQMQY